MLTRRQITRQLRVDNPYEVIARDSLQECFNGQLANKCAGGMYCTGIVRILAKSPWEKVNGAGFHGAQLSAVIEIEGLVAPPDYIIPNCTIKRKTDKIIVFENEYATGTCKVSIGMDFLREGLIVPMRVVESQYVGEKIAVSARLFSHDVPWPTYRVVPGDVAIPPAILARVDAVAAKLAAAPPDAIAQLFNPIIAIGKSAGGKPFSVPPAIHTTVELARGLTAEYCEVMAGHVDSLPPGEVAMMLAQHWISYVECFLSLIQHCDSKEKMRQYAGVLRYMARR